MSVSTYCCDAGVCLKQLTPNSDGESLFPEGECTSAAPLASRRQHGEEFDSGEVPKLHDGTDVKLRKDNQLRLGKTLQPKRVSMGMLEGSVSSASSDKIKVQRVKPNGGSQRVCGDDAGSRRCSLSSLASGSDSLVKIRDGKAVVEAGECMDDEEEICCICLEEYTEENPVIYGECKHHFHLPCLMNWKQRSNVCPMCASESLRGLADDDVDTSPAPAADDDIFALFWQHQLERYARLQGRRNRESGRTRTRGQQVDDRNAERRTRNVTVGQSRPDRNGALSERQQHMRGRGANGGGRITPSTGRDMSSRNTTVRESGPRSRETNENNVSAFFNRIFSCFRR